MTVMLRRLGVPARYINGFLAGEYNDVGGDYIIRASDAHSWVEVYFPGYGWMTFDPTPPSSEVAGGVLSQLGLYWDWFQLQWSEWVINYDFLHQYTLAQGVQRASRGWTASVRQAFDRDRSAAAERVRKWATTASQCQPGPRSCWRCSPLPCCCLQRAAARAPALRLEDWAWKMGAPKIGLGQEVRPLRPPRSSIGACCACWNARLAQIACQTPLEFAASLPAREFAAPASQLTKLCMAASFGGQDAEFSRLADVLDQLKLSLRRRSRRAK